MLWPFPGNTNITANFNDPRPLSNPGKHPHGAIDIGLKVGSPIIAPERGTLFGYYSIRPVESIYWPVGEQVDNPYRNYFYDMYGGLLVLKGDSGITHIFTHIYMNQLRNKNKCLSKWKPLEQKANARFPIFCERSENVRVYPGAEIGNSGNAGYSTGAHCHYEQHRGFKWQSWEDRPDPEKTDWKEFK